MARCRRSPPTCATRSSTRSRCSRCSSRSKRCRCASSTTRPTPLRRQPAGRDRRRRPDFRPAGAVRTYQGYEARDTRTSMLMGFGSLLVNGTARIFALLGYAALYVLAPVHLDAHRWYTWVFALIAVDLLFYTEHRAAHRVRILWAAHQAHHNSQRFNLSTAVRQKWNPWWELLVWVPLPLMGIAPWLIFSRLLGQPDLPVLRAHRAHRPHVAPRRARLQHAVAPSGAPRQRSGVPRQELRRHVDHLGPDVRLVRRGDAPPDVRPDQERRQLQPVPAAVPRVRGRSSATSAAAAPGASASGYLFAPPGWTPRPPRSPTRCEPA